MYICPIDQTQHESLEALHKHLRKLKITQENYYTNFASQRDLATNEIIPYKYPSDKYIKTEFVGKSSLEKFLKEKPKESKEWAINWLRKRKEEKKLIYPPTQTELRSLMCPNILDYNRMGGYTNICRQLGFQIRFNGSLPNNVLPHGPIIIDTREQNPLELKINTIRQKLWCGDYGLTAEHDRGIYIERKSLQDLVLTLSGRETKPGNSNLLRFRRELERGREIGDYIIMVVEFNINNALEFSRLPHMKHCFVSEQHIFKNLRDLLCDFDNFQAVFVGGRTEAARVTLRLLACEESVKNVDLELEYEEGRL